MFGSATAFQRWGSVLAMLVACSDRTPTTDQVPPTPNTPRQWRARALLASAKGKFATEDSSISHFQVHGVSRDGMMDPVDGRIQYTKFESGRCLELDWSASDALTAEGDHYWSTSATQLGLCLPNLYGTASATRCGIDEIWERAVARNAAPSAFAHIAFMPNAPGGAWTFWLGDYKGGFKVDFEDDCVPIVEAPR